MKRRKFLLTAATASAGLTLPLRSHAQISSMTEAVNRAGRQRMLSQRVAKAWLGIATAARADLAKLVMQQSIEAFEQQLVELKAFAPVGETRDTYQTLDSQWSEYKTVLIGAAPSRDRAKGVLDYAGKVLALANSGTVLFEKQSGTPSAKLVNVAGRQRMLSQRMGMFYLANFWGVESASSRTEIAKARTEFIAAQDLLRNAPQTTTQIRQELDIADGQWVFFNNALQAQIIDSRAAADVFVCSENLLKVMDQITGLYTRTLT